MPKVYSCEVTGSETLAGSVFSVTVGADDLANSASAGQFVHIKCGEKRLLRRPVSICCADDGILRFVFEVRGAGTDWLSRRAPGDTLDILGPLGTGFIFPEGNIITVGGGIGTPPLLFAAKSAKGGATAVLGFRDKNRVMLEREFEEVCGEVYVTTDDGSYGIHGAVTKPLESLLQKGGHSAVLACGPRAMLSSVAALCERYGTSCQVSLEERMGCGVGACLVCACRTVKDGKEFMSRVCKDGPVFYAGEVVW